MTKTNKKTTANELSLTLTGVECYQEMEEGGGLLELERALYGNNDESGPITPAKVKSVPLTHEIVKLFASIPLTSHDRKLSQNRKAKLRLMMRTAVRTFVWSVAIVGESVYRINGQTSLSVLQDMIDDGSFPVGAWVVMEVYVCDTHEQMRMLQRDFDSAASVRNTADLVHVEKSYEKDIGHLSDSMLSTVAAAVCLYRCDFQKQTAKQEKLDMMADDEYQRFVLWLSDNGMYVTPGSPVRRLAVVAAVLATWRVDKSDAASFWTAVHTGTIDSPSANYPTRKLRETLIMGTATGDRIGKYNLEEMKCEYAACIYLWNRFRTGSNNVKSVRSSYPIYPK